MRKTILLLMMALFVGGTLAAQESHKQLQTFSSKVDSLSVKGGAVVTLIDDSASYIEVQYPSEGKDMMDKYKTVFIQNNVMTIIDTTGELRYYVHIVPEQFKSVTVDERSTVTFPNGTVRGPQIARTYANFSELGEEIKRFVDALVTTMDSVSSSLNDANATPYSKKSTDKAKEKKRRYSISDRTDFKFLWAFTNWGDQWYSGLMKMDGANNLRTSFSSYQLEEHFAVMMTRHWSLSLGIGYESDVYKMTNNYVSMGAGGDLYVVDQTNLDAVSSLQGTSLDGWSSRLVTRYVSLPITLQYRDVGIFKKFKMSLSVIPALGFNSSHTGLKHEYERKGRNFQDVEDISTHINPYKVDVRLSFQRKWLGMFLQLPTMPLFIDNTVKVYPIKIGFVF